MYAFSRAMLFVAALVSLLMTSVALAANVSWDDGAFLSKDWSDFLNWDPLGGPTGDDLSIGNLAAAQGDSTVIDQDFTINSLSLTNGADADTSGNVLTVTGDITVSGIGSTFVASEHSSGPGFTVVEVEDITLSANGAFVLQGGTVALLEPGGGAANVGQVTINANSFLSGYGILRFADGLSGVETIVLHNDGILQTRRAVGSPDTQRFNLRMESTDANARVDLDGIFDIGVVTIDENTTLDLAVEAEVFHATMTFEAGAILDLSETLDTSGATINVNAGFGAPGVPTTAIVRGNRLIAGFLQANATQFNVNSGTFILEEGMNLNAISAINLAPNTTLVFDDILPGGGTISPIKGQINFNGVGAELVIEAGRVNIDAASWDWDGPEDATTTINGGTLTINSNDISPSAIDDSFDGTVNINDSGILAPDISGGWIFAGDMNLDSTGNGTPTVVSTAVMTIDGGQINAIGGTSVLDLPIIFTSDVSGSTAVAASSTLRFTKNVSFQGGSTHTGAGELEFSDAIFTVSGNQTINMTGGTVNLSANATEAETWFLNAHFIVNADTLGEFGNNTSADTDTIVIDHATNSSSKLTVNLDAPADEWTLGPDGIINILGTAALNISIAGSDLNVEGDVVITDTTVFAARIDVESNGQITVNTPGHQLRLIGGSAVDPNTINGGTITGAGELSSNGTGHLVGHGTIDTDIDFDGAADLLATGGTLTVTGNILDADLLGTQDATGTLTLTQNVNTANFTALELNGGKVNVTATDLFNNGLIRGQGQLNSTFLRNNGLIEATGGMTLTINTTNSTNLDGANGAGDDGEVEAILGDVVIVNSLTDSFDGTITVGGGRFIDFQSGWTLGTNGTLNLNGVGLARATLDGDGATLRGTVNVDEIGAILGDTTFASDVTVNLPVAGDILELSAESIIASGAVFVGGGGLVVTGGSSTLVLADGADVDVPVVNQGTLQIGASPGSATVAAFQQFNGSTLEIEIDGAGPSDYDILFVDQLNATLDGDLDVTLTGGFMPSAGDTFNIIQVLLGTRIGTFDTVAADLPALPGGLTWLIDYDPITGEGVTLEVITSLGADLDGDGDVDGSDFLLIQRTNPALIPLWESQYGSSSAVANSQAVPEPSTVWLILIALASIGTVRRR